MRLDIHICTNNHNELFGKDYHDKKYDHFNKHRLSRQFCNLIFQNDIVKPNSELEQISEITNVNISLLYDMKKYRDDEEILYLLKYEELYGKAKQTILKNHEIARKKVEGNLAKVLLMINNLIEKLSEIESLEKILTYTDFDTIDAAYYFSDFKQDKGKGYIRNNFGQDLRNFRQFLIYAKERGTTTVWFYYN